MIKYSYFFFIIIFILGNSCTKSEKKENIIKETNLALQFTEAYNEGMDALEGGDVLFAAKKFNEAEILFPQSAWAPNAALMAAYSYYIQDYYGDAIAELIRFKKVYPYHENLDYVNYLLAISYYEQIVDEKKDLQSLIKSKKYFELILNRYSDTEYAKDAEFKIDYINDILAAKEMYIGRFYFQKKKWIPAINRFRTVIDNYETTIYTEEALYRLVEVYYTLGLKSEAEKYAILLGYNYQSSKWYERSYGLFDKMYEKNKKENFKKENKKSNIVLKRFKSLFELDE
jgi:outer membrane protein assembly factor BamD